MRHFKNPLRDQGLLIAHVILDSVAPVGSAVRAINDMIDALDTSEIEKSYDLDSVTGRLPFHPKTIIKVCLFAIHSCRFSLRKMEADTELNLGYRWLTGNEIIDHTTIAKFLTKHRDFIEELFTQTVLVAVAEELIDFDVLAIDSVKLRANASHKQDRSLASLDKEETKIKARIKELLNAVEKEATGLKELETLQARELKLKLATSTLAERIAEKVKDKSASETEKIKEKTKINITDFDAHKMQQANGEINPSYHITTAVDAQSDIMTYFKINEEDNDNKALLPVIEGSEKNCEQKHDKIVADPGFSSFGNLERLEAQNQSALIPDKYFEVDERGDHKRGAYDRFHFKYDGVKNCYTCPAGETLEQESVIHVNGREVHRYSNASACQKCPLLAECTRGTNRTITRDANQEIKEDMRVALAEETNKEIYKLRAHAAESPFGNIKHNLKYRILLRRRAERIKIEVGLLFMLHNILKIAAFRRRIASE